MPLDYADSYNVANEAGNSVLGNPGSAVLATVADIGTTLWNSLPLTPRVETEDVLSRISDNALSVYNENPDTIRTASLVAGALIPGGLTMKLLNRARTGAASLGYVGEAFAGTRQKALVSEIADIFKNAGAATTEYKNATRKLLLANAVQGTIDNAIIEVAVVGAMNQHPYMQDYLEDPVKNFTVNVALGAGLGTILAIPASNRAVREATAGLATDIFSDVLSTGFKPSVPKSATTSVQYQTHLENLKILDTFLQDDSKSPFAKEIVSSFRLQTAADAKRAMIEAFPDFEKVSPEIQQAMSSLMEDSRFTGVDKIRFYDMAKFGKETSKLAKITGNVDIAQLGLQQDLDLMKIAYAKIPKAMQAEYLDLINANNTFSQNHLDYIAGKKSTIKEIPSTFVSPEGVAQVAFVRASTGEIFAASGAGNAAHAVDIKNIKQILDSPEFAPVNAYLPSKGFAEDNLFRNESAAFQDARFLKALKQFNKLPESEWSRINIGPDDLPAMNAFFSLAEKLSPEARTKLKVNIRSDLPLYQAQRDFVANTVSPTHLKDILSTTEDRALTFDSQGISDGASRMLDNWVHGSHLHQNIELGKAQLRRAMDNFLHHVVLPAGEEGNAEYAREIWEAGAAYRNSLRQYADADGYVYMYRGSSGVEKTSTTVASFTPKYLIAKNFADNPAGLALYKIKVDNIIGSLGSGRLKEAEVLVASAGHTAVEELPTSTTAAAAPTIKWTDVTPGAWTKAAYDKVYEAVYNKYQAGYNGDFTQPLNDLEIKLINNEKLTSDEINALKQQYSNLLSDGAPKALEVPNQREVTSGHIDVDTFYKLYANETEAQARAMFQNGNFSVEEIAARLNMKPEAVQMMLGGQSLSEVGIEWRRYTDVAEMDKYLDPKNKLYAIIGNPNKAQRANDMVGLDNRQLRQANTDLIEQQTIISTSAIGAKLLEIYQPQEMQMMLDRLLSHMAEVNNQTISKPYLQSLDNALRHTKIGPTITWLGKQLTNAQDQLIKEHVEPLAHALVPFTNKPEAIAEMSQFLNKLASLKGWREIEIDETTGKGHIIQRSADDKSINRIKNSDGTDYVINSQEILDAVPVIRQIGAELYKMHNLNRSIKGQGALNDLGFYVPPTSLVGKSYAFVIDNAGKIDTQVLVAANDAELQSLMQAWKAEHVTEKSLQVVTKGEQNDYNLAKSYVDYQAYVTYANVGMEHTGASSLAVIPSDARLLANMQNSFENQIRQTSRQYAELYMSDVTSYLDRLSTFYQRGTLDQPKIGLAKEKAKDAAMTVKNAILGRDNLEQSPGWKGLSNITDFLINRGVQTVDNFIRATPFEKTTSKEYFDGLQQKLKDIGVTQPIWGSFQEYLAASKTEARNIAPTVISTGNGLLATLQLRMFDLAYAAVNVMSLPILTWSSLMDKLPGTVVNAAGDGVKFPLRLMGQAISHMFSAEGRRLETTMWEPKGLLNQTTRQFTEVLGALHQSYLGNTASEKAVQIANNIQNNKFIKEFLAAPADWSENFTRRFAMHVGYLGAKTAYPGIGDIEATIAATNMADRIVGNYHAAQRPITFQGSFGSAISLYQTYFLTFAQHVYSGLEDRNFKQLAALMLPQAGIFGIASWPGYNLISENLIANMNDKHYDITTGTYRALGNTGAEIALYGLPSSLGPAVYTRGDIQPRIPSTMGEIALFNGVKQAYTAAAGMIKGVSSGMQDGNATRNLLEALSLQSLNRPIARAAEIATGTSITGQGNTVSTTNDVWTPMGVFARMLSTRPIEEQTLRNASHLYQYYETVDHDNRQAAMEKVKVALRAGNLNDELVASTAQTYLRRGGTSQGWTSVMNETLLRSSEGTRLDLLRKLEPDSPLRQMISERY